jgi:hypothetical protein
MKILIIGDANHQFLYNFVSDLKLYFNNRIQVDILSTSRLPLKKSAQVYDNVYTPLINSALLNINGFRIWWRRFILKNHIKKISAQYDICNIHYADKDILPSVNDIKKFSKKIICSVWGSDVYRAPEKILNKQKDYYNKIDLITFENNHTLEFFDNIFHLPKSKYQFFTFHLKPLELMKKFENISRKEIKKFFNIDPDKIIITVGYSASPGAQHIRVIETLKKDNKLIELKNKICFFFPLTYPKNNNYLSKLKHNLNSFPFEYKLFLDFMPNEQIAYLRNASDIFIIVTVTDQLSGSLLEHLYAKSVVLAGEWLPYKVLEEKGTYFRKVSETFSNLGTLLLDTVVNLEREVSKCIPNTDTIAQINNWDVIMKNWYDIYSDLQAE